MISVIRACRFAFILGLVIAPASSVYLRAQGTTPSTSSGNNGRSTGGGQPSTRSYDRQQGPMYVGGRILMETNQPVPESVSVELNCGMRPLQVIHTDLGGYFTFSLGSGIQSNMDFSASNENPMMQAGGRPISRPGSNASLTGCELRVSVPGYRPLTYTLADHADMDRLDVGVLHLNRIAGVEGSAISVTSLMVPNDARKEYEKAEKELRNNKSDAAKPHLEKAVGIYDKYAAAWNALGRIYLNSKETAKAQEAFGKAIAADAQYIPPYMSLASLELQNREYEKAAGTAGKLLELDPSIGYASFIEAVANFNLKQLDAAEKSALAAEKTSDGKLPQVHALLAEIFLQKQNYEGAASQMKAYLKEEPQGQFAAEMRHNLEEIQKATAENMNQNSPESQPAAQ